MLKVFLGDLKDEIYNPPIYFDNQYEDEWITDALSRQMILDIDKSDVISSHIIESPYLGAITPKELSGGVKTLILMANDESGSIFNATACGDNCAKWILEIANRKDLIITLHHGMRFGEGPFEIMILNTGRVVHNRQEWLDVVYDYV
ncbi:DUF4869 domain-containing protein [Blautia sp. HCP3S3_G3]|uniref:DUF4869 domain-containing protein n=1 Tax=Blautia sp. HCP3S3_G3 TaxID=3438913 RepID=UPI00303A07EE|nr:DUF4869 domain-containing protein [Blautia sp.]